MVTDRRRILRVITRLNVGGPARHALLLSRALAPSWTTRLVAGTPPLDEGELVDPGVTVNRAPLVRPLSPITDLRGLAALVAEVRRYRPGIVHTHMAKAGALGRVAASLGPRRSRPATVHTFHGHVLDGYFGKTTESAFIASERSLASRTDVLVAVSEPTRDSLLDLGIGRPSQWRVIPLGLELDRHWAVTGPTGALRHELGLALDVPLVGMVGRLAPIKDPATLIRAMARLDDVHLVVIGDGELRSASEHQVAEMGIAHRVHFIGWRYDMPAVLADLDLIALSSLNEGTPLAIIEAAACGIPAVATDVGGVGTVIDHESTGLLVSSRDDEALADALGRLVADPLARHRLGERAREGSHRFSAQRLIADVEQLYDELA